MTPQQARARLKQLQAAGILWPDTLAEARHLAWQHNIKTIIERRDLNTGAITLIDLSTGEVQQPNQEPHKPFTKEGRTSWTRKPKQ